MSQSGKDPLLITGKVMTIILMALTAIVAVVMIGAIPAILFNQADFATAVAEAGGGNTEMALTATILLLLSGAVVAAIAFHFFQLLLTKNFPPKLNPKLLNQWGIQKHPLEKNGKFSIF